MADELVINPAFLSTTTGREIYDLGEVEKVHNRIPVFLNRPVQDINKLLQLAASCVSLLTIPELDPRDEAQGQGQAAQNGASPSSEASTPRQPVASGPRSQLPVGEERAEQFVQEATQYYETLDAIQMNLRSAMAHLRRARVAPATITAPAPGFAPAAVGVGPEAGINARGLQETRLERDAWQGVVDALQRLAQTQKDA